eukprot:gene1270-30262_t
MFAVGTAVSKLYDVFDRYDSHKWLENVLDEKCIDWAKARNAESISHVGKPTASPVHDKILKILENKDKIPYTKKIGDLYYNLWQDEKNVKGLWRRCTLEEYKKEKPEWETVLDLDELNKSEGENFVWKGTSVLDLGPEVHTDLVLMKLSRGGADATVIREFNVDKKAFVSENAFNVGEAKTSIGYKSRDIVLIGTDTGEGSLTDSGYPRVVLEWKRGTPLSDATKVYEGEKEDVSVNGYWYHDRGSEWEFVSRGMTFYTSEKYIRSADGVLTRLQIPDHTEVSTFADQLTISLREDWQATESQNYAGGSLLAIPLSSFLAGDLSKLQVLFKPSARAAMESFSGTKNYLIVALLENVQSKLKYWKYDYDAHIFVDDGREPFSFPDFATVYAQGDSPDVTDDVWLTRTGFTAPTTLFYSTAEPTTAEPEVIKQLPAMYNAADLEVTQGEATSKDGTKIPYFQIAKTGLVRDGNTPTLLYGYELHISLTPYYAATAGVGWLERGGVFIYSNIRGGGEFGPKWHQAALKENRNKAYEDFIAIAEQLIAEKVTSTPRLGIQGGSNGGLLMGNMLTMRPDLWGAIVCQTVYPPTLFTTSTRDDRVHPAHARKMMQKLRLQQDHSMWYYENIEGGHGGAADNKQRAFMTTLVYDFLWKTLSKM